MKSEDEDLRLDRRKGGIWDIILNSGGAINDFEAGQHGGTPGKPSPHGFHHDS
jgi:hypothetical protein